jgi:predicted transcriptional regulator
LKRSQFDIMKDILKIAKRKPTKSAIQYGANLNFRQLQEYLGLLQDINLLSLIKNNGKSCYKTTEKGFSFLEKYREIQSLMDYNENGKEIS